MSGAERAANLLQEKETWKKTYYANLPEPTKESRQVVRARKRKAIKMTKTLMNRANQGKNRRPK